MEIEVIRAPGQSDEDSLLLCELLLKLDPRGNDDELRVISILDNEAMCKTALARSVYGRFDVKHWFPYRAWVNVQDNSSAEEVLANILRQISTRDLEDVDRADENKLSRRLYDYFFEQRYLVVLDNISRADVMVRLLASLVDSNNGSRVVITTGKDNLLPFIDPWAVPFQFHPLTKEFHPSTKDDRKLLLLPWSNESEPAEQVPSAGSPFAQRILSLAENPTLRGIVSSCYKELSPKLQDCVKYVCQFPREYDIPTRRLLRLWLAEGLVSASHGGIQDAEECFRELVSKNMLYVVSRDTGLGFAKTCRMPGFIYDFLIQEQSNQTLFNAKQICSYISFNTKKIRQQKGEIDSILNTKKSELIVLDLEGVYKPDLPINPGNVFRKLKYLGLRWTILSELPKSIGDLPCLETLDVKHTNITKMPSSVWTKKSLRHLYLNELNLDKSIPHRGRLSPFSKRPKVNNLQTLCGLRFEAKSPILDAFSKLTGIRKLSLTCPSTMVEEVIKRMKGLSTLQSLKLKSKDLLGQPSKIRVKENMKELSSLSKLHLFGSLRGDHLLNLPENLKSLTLSMSFLKNDPTNDPINRLGMTLTQLTDLRLYGHSYHGTYLKFSNNQQLPKLRTLKMWKLDKLESLIVEKEAIRCLEELEIRDCQKLKEIDIEDDREALKEVTLAKVKKNLAKSFQNILKRPIIITMELIASPDVTDEKGLGAN